MEKVEIELSLKNVNMSKHHQCTNQSHSCGAGR